MGYYYFTIFNYGAMQAPLLIYILLCSQYCYCYNTVTSTQNFLKPHGLLPIIISDLCNITKHTASHITDLQNDNDIILTITNKNMSWTLVSISWFSNEYERHFSDTLTYKRIDNFDSKQAISDSNTLLRKLKPRFSSTISNRNNHQLLDPTPSDRLQLQYMKLLPKVHKLDKPASPDNISKLTGPPIITAHS